MPYTLRQLNNKFNQDSKSVAAITKIFNNLALSFGGTLGVDNFTSIELPQFTENTENPTQFFYLTHPSDQGEDIASIVQIVLRDGLKEQSINLLVTMVFTHPNYRSKGLFNKLFNWVINYYENEQIDESDELLIISDELKGKDCKLFLDTIVDPKYRESKKIHWSLYSIVDDYYKKFGFIGCNDLKWYILDDENITVNDFKLKNNEFLLTENDIEKYFISPDYNFVKEENENTVNCCYEFNSLKIFYDRFKSYLKLDEKEIDDNDLKYFNRLGLLIKDEENNCESLIFACPFFFMNQISIYRLYTSCPNTEIFQQHWQRFNDYLSEYSSKIWNDLPFMKKPHCDDKKDEQVSTKSILLTPNDFVTKTLLKDDIVNVICSSNSHWNIKESTAIALPMVRDWKAENKNLQLAHNGQWCFL